MQAQTLAVLALCDAAQYLPGLPVPAPSPIGPPFEAFVSPLVLGQIAINAALETGVHGGEDFHAIAGLFDLRCRFEVQMDVFDAALTADAGHDEHVGPVALHQLVDQCGCGHLIAKEWHAGITAVARVMVGENPQGAAGFHGRQGLFHALAVGGDQYRAGAFPGGLDHGVHQGGGMGLVHDQGPVTVALVAHIQITDLPAALVQGQHEYRPLTGAGIQKGLFAVDMGDPGQGFFYRAMPDMAEFGERTAQFRHALAANALGVGQGHVRMGGQQIDQNDPVGAGVTQRQQGDQGGNRGPEGGDQWQR